MTEKYRDRLLALRNSRVPEKNEVPFPKFPESRLLIGDTSSSETAPTPDRIPLIGIFLVSKSNLLDVADWYGGVLRNYSRLAFSNAEGRTVIAYVDSCISFKSVQECIDSVPRRPHVLVTEMGPSLQALAVEYRTLIEMVYEQPTAPEIPLPKEN